MSETSGGYTEINGLSHLEPDYCWFGNTVDFFKELLQFVVKAGSILSNIYGVDWENKLEVLGLQAIYFATLTARAKYVWIASCFCFLRK
ncbi:retinoblastoma-related protein-like [Pyrus ussuriensis x Pyrus communis]|uniref:Retinoblastoma-related protein-like n=1 Tax=Pyrus ussuriensis x Pyrus communis TaxID=2448454 RepID=A0A5N5GW00_9ROSA|nr:retinoblastoma-related protein-like [Pyrus ussuriensis x Pyrus communis]